MLWVIRARDKKQVENFNQDIIDILDDLDKQHEELAESAAMELGDKIMLEGA